MKCKICGSGEEHPIFHPREMIFGDRTQFSYFKCVDCGCLQIESFPTNISEYYSDKYYSFIRASREPVGWRRHLLHKRDLYAATGKGQLGRFLYQMRPNHNLKSLQGKITNRDARVLDIGCGAGKLIFELREIGYRNVAGVDPFLSSEMTYDNGVRIQNCSLHEITGHYDLIMFHHSFEHVSDPLETLVSVKRILAKNGRCLIRIPMVSSYAWEKYGINWAQLDAPRHFYLHSRKSMEILCRKAGFEIESTVFDSTKFQFWASQQISDDIPLRDPRSDPYSPNFRYSADTLKKMEAEAARLNALNLGDQACFYLK